MLGWSLVCKGKPSELYVCTLSPNREVVELFRRDELLDWGEFEATFGPVLRDGVEDGPATTVFQRGDVLGDQQWEDFRKRVIEHVSVHIVFLEKDQF